MLGKSTDLDSKDYERPRRSVSERRQGTQDGVSAITPGVGRGLHRVVVGSGYRRQCPVRYMEDRVGALLGGAFQSVLGLGLLMRARASPCYDIA